MHVLPHRVYSKDIYNGSTELKLTIKLVDSCYVAANNDQLEQADTNSCACLLERRPYVCHARGWL